jgi:N-acetylneuraminic acid mutarotase
MPSVRAHLSALVVALALGSACFQPGAGSPAGGANNPLSTAEQDGGPNPTEARNPSRAAPMPLPLVDFAATTWNGRIYIFGGYSGSTVDLAAAYDPTSDVWTTLPPLPSPRAGAAALTVGDRIYVIGGYQGHVQPVTYTIETQVFDPTTNTWSTPAPPPPFPKPFNDVYGNLLFSASTLNGLIYVFVDGRDGNPRTLMFDPGSNTWTVLGPMPLQLGTAAASVGDRVFVVQNDEIMGTAGFAEYRPQQDLWIMRPAPPATCSNGASRCTRNGTALASLNGAAYAIGGSLYAGVDSPQVIGAIDRYDPVSESWTTIAQLSTARQFEKAVELDGKLYVLGGSSAGWAQAPVPLDSVEIWSP